ncbi:MAG: DUF1587 domain-containing protein [Opitutales bacterium]
MNINLLSTPHSYELSAVARVLVQPVRPKQALMVAISAALCALAGAKEIEFPRAQELIRQYCVECHNPADEKGGLDLAVLETEADYLSKPTLLEDLEWVVAEHEMPVPDAPKQPTKEERDVLVTWLRQELMKIENARPNDPGTVVMPRISSKEFDYVIHDLTGHDYDLAQYLTSDTAAGEGFYNVGAGQQLSIGQFESFMAVGKMLMDHARFVPGEGIWWMDTPVPVLEEDSKLPDFLKEQWKDWYDHAIDDLRERHERALKQHTPFEGFGAYLEAAWLHQQHRPQAGDDGLGLASIAEDYQPRLFLSSLEKTVAILRDSDEPGPVEVRENLIFAEIVRRWQELPQPRERDDRSAVREQISEIMEWAREAGTTHDYKDDWADNPIEIDAVDRPEAQQRRGFYHAGRGYLKIDLTKVDGEYLYLAASDQWYPAEMPENTIVIWRNGKVKMEDGSTLPWNKVFPDLTTQEGARIHFGDHPKRSLAEGEVAHEIPGYLKLRIPANARILEVDATYDLEQSHKRAMRAIALGREPSDYLATFSGRKTIGLKMPEDAIEDAVKDIDGFQYFDAHFRNLYTFRGDDVFVGQRQDVLDYLGIESAPEPADRHNYWRSLWSWTPEEG